jgi:hypothetical protein
MKEKINPNGFIQIPLFIAIIAGILVFGSGGYFGVKQYQSYQAEKNGVVQQSVIIPTPTLVPTSTPIPSSIVISTQVLAPTSILAPMPSPTPILTPTLTAIPQKQLTEKESIIKDFLDNPSVDNLKVFCDKAKNVQSQQTKEVLSEDKTAIETINKTLSEVLTSCRYLTYPNSHFFLSNLDSLLVNLDSSDNDSIRIIKIKYNDQIKEYDQKYKVYGCSTIYPTISSQLSNMFLPGLSSRYRDTFLRSIIIPEVEIKNLANEEGLRIE